MLLFLNPLFNWNWSPGFVPDICLFCGHFSWVRGRQPVPREPRKYGDQWHHWWQRKKLNQFLKTQQNVTYPCLKPEPKRISLVLRALTQPESQAAAALGSIIRVIFIQGWTILEQFLYCIWHKQAFLQHQTCMSSCSSYFFLEQTYVL